MYFLDIIHHSSHTKPRPRKLRCLFQDHTQPGRTRGRFTPRSLQHPELCPSTRYDASVSIRLQWSRLGLLFRRDL